MALRAAGLLLLILLPNNDALVPQPLFH